MLFDSIFDALLDTLRLLPFLLLAFLLVEWLEHHSASWLKTVLGKVNKTGPVLGALLGCIPQCGFSVTTANLYAGGVVSLGTLLAVFLATSDEAVLILLGHPGQGSVILRLLLCKVEIAVLVGYAIDLVLRLMGHRTTRNPHDFCESEHCGCSGHHGIWYPALMHTAKLAFYLLVFNLALNLILAFIGEDFLSSILLNGSVFQPLLTAVIGMIPNCAASVLVTELYLAGGISFGSALAGLCAGAGVGLAVLFRAQKNVKRNLMVMAVLYAVSVASGMIANLLL